MGSNNESAMCRCRNHTPLLPKLTPAGGGSGSMIVCEGHGGLVLSGGVPPTAGLTPVDRAPRREWGKRVWGQGPGCRERGKELGLRREEQRERCSVKEV